MIYGSSSDPVLIKKIYLKCWTLRDEVEAVIARRVAAGEDPEKLDIEKLIKEYKYRGPVPDVGGLTVIDGGAAGDGGTESSDQSEEGEESAEADGAAKEEAEAALADAESSEGEPSNAEAEADTNTPVKVVQRGSENIAPEKQHHGVVMLSEVGMDHMYFFCTRNFLAGQSIVVEFQVPKRFILNGEIAFCRAYNMRSRIISDNKLPYRVALKFTFLKPGERTLLRNFIESIEPEIVEEVHIKKSAGDGGGGDDFDELDDLDL